MPGFPLAAIGAGLGEWARNAQQQQLLQQNQQDQQLRRQLQMMQLRELLEGKQSARTAADAAAGFLTGGGGGIGPVNPTPGLGIGTGVPIDGGGGLAPGFARGSDGGLTRNGQPPDTHIGGTPAWTESTSAPANASDAWLRQNAPFQTQGRAGPQPDAGNLPWRMAAVGPEAYDAAAGPGALAAPTPLHQNLPPPRGAAPGVNFPNAQVADASGVAPGMNVPPRPPSAAPSGGIGAPPPEYDPALVAAAIKRARPGISNQDLVAAVDLVGKELGPKVKGAYDRWKTQAELYYRGQDLAQRGQHHSEDLAQRGQIHSEDLAQRGQFHTDEMGDKTRRFLLDTDKFGFEKEDKALGRQLEGRRIGGEEAGRGEAARHNVAGETLGQDQLAETRRQHDRTFDTKQRAIQGKADAATTEMKTLASRARDLYAAVEQNPNLVGVRGRGARMFGGAAEQAKIKQQDEASAAFLSELNILKAGLQASKFQGARYFSKAAMEQLSALVPGEGALDNPTKVKSALRALADRLDEKATEIGATTQGVGADYKSMSDEELLRSIGITPGQQ